MSNDRTSDKHTVNVNNYDVSSHVYSVHHYVCEVCNKPAKITKRAYNIHSSSIKPFAFTSFIFISNIISLMSSTSDIILANMFVKTNIWLAFIPPPDAFRLIHCIQNLLPMLLGSWSYNHNNHKFHYHSNLHQ